MNRDEAKQWLPILQAYADGKTIQVMGEISGWYDVNVMLPSDRSWDRYRIKPEPKLRPWKPEEMPKGPFLVVAAECHPLDRWERMYACRVVNNGVQYPNSPWFFQVAAPNMNSRTSYDPTVMAAQFVMLHPDGSTSPCGVLEAQP